jgi:hemerythrin superfamily protein
MFENASRLGHDLRKRALTTSDDLRRRALTTSDDLVRRAQSQSDDLISRLQPYTDSLLRRVRPHKPTPMEEARSFLSSPGAAVAGAVAVGVMAGIALSAGRKVAMQGAEALHGDWFEILKAEHRMVDKLFEQLLQTSDNQRVKRTLLLGKIAHALSKHAMQEEMVIYPALKAANSNGQAMHLYEDHAQIKIFIHDLQEIHKDDPLWIERARAFHKCVMHHVREEEDEIFPTYHGRMSPQQNRHLTLMVHKEGLKLA